MANDITSINSSRAQQSGTRQSQRLDDDSRKSASSINSNTGSSSSDKVSLTSTASRLKDIEQRLSTQTPVDNNRVNQMKSAINNGEYDIDADRVAGKMIDFESSLRP